MRSVWLIEKAWIDPLENHNAHGYDVYGYVKKEKKAISICENGGYYTEKDCWSILVQIKKFRYRKLNEVKNE